MVAAITGFSLVRLRLSSFLRSRQQHEPEQIEPSEQIEHHDQAMRNSHASLSRSRGQLQRRSRELTLARERFLETLRSYEGRLMALGQEKAKALRIAQEMHHELETFEDKQQAIDGLLEELDAAKEEAGYWSIFSITRLIERMRRLLRGGDEA